MLQVIKRTDGEKPEIETFNGSEVQVSFNDWGHLVLRIITKGWNNETHVMDDPEQGVGHTELQKMPGRDVLAVFDKQTSARIIRFCQNELTPV